MTQILDTMTDDELRAVKTRAEELLKLHDNERKAKAVEEVRALNAKAQADARALLASVGLSLKAVTGKSRKHSATYKGGRLYRHPAKPELVWNAKGQKPNWLRELENHGGRAEEMPANHSAVPVKKTG
jgi:hypothetical protein